ncbi:hypothetical protein D3C86_2106710 [compost metagenome]
MAGEHDGADAGNPAQQDINNIQRQRQQHRVAHPTVGVAHPFDGGHHRGIGV